MIYVASSIFHRGITVSVVQFGEWIGDEEGQGIEFTL